MCYCTPSLRTPFCNNCASVLMKEKNQFESSANHMFDEVQRLNAIIGALGQSKDMIINVNEIKRTALEHCAQYFDLLDETYPMTPPQIAASIRRQEKAIQ